MLLETVTKYGGIHFRRIQETLIAATFWTKYVTSRNYFPVDGMLVTIT